MSATEGAYLILGLIIIVCTMRWGKWYEIKRAVKNFFTTE